MVIRPTSGVRGRRRLPLAGILAFVALVAVGMAVSTGLSLASTAKGPVTNYLKYVGGKHGKANTKLSPVYIGWVNQQGGQTIYNLPLDAISDYSSPGGELPVASDQLSPRVEDQRGVVQVLPARSTIEAARI